MESYNEMVETSRRGNFFGPYPNCSSSSASMVSLFTPNTSNQETNMGILGSLISPARFQSCPLSVVDQKRNYEKEFAVGSASSPNNNDNTSSTSDVEAMKSKIMSHPQFSNLLHSYIECQKVGAPPEMGARLAAIWREFESRQRSSTASLNKQSLKDPELDQFMEAYSVMMVKYKEEVTRPVQEAMEFMGRIQSQLNILTNGRLHAFPCDERSEDVGSSEEDQDIKSGGGGTELGEINPRAEDRELKNHLLKKYSGYFGSLKQELSKKKKVRKLPKEARQKLLTWWELHYKWPYPSESEKAALAEATGLDQKQINNWFINQRKRHWRPSEDMQFMVMEGIHPHNLNFPPLLMDADFMGETPFRFAT